MSDQPLSKLLISEPPLQVLPSLAVRLGLDASIFAQQLHYMLINPKLGKLIEGRKWIFCTLEEWHETYPFWCINTIRKIIEDLVKAEIVLEGNFNETLNRRKWYTLDYDQLNTAIIKQPKSPRPENANFGNTMKLRKKAKRAAPVVNPNSGRSMIQTLDVDSYTPKNSSETSLNSFEAKASHELADTPSEQETKAKLPHLNETEREAMKRLLHAVQNGKVVEADYAEKVVRYLIELGEIERCEFGLYPGLCLKGKPTTDKEFDPEPTQDELLANLRTSLQEAKNGKTHPIAELWNDDLPPMPQDCDARFFGTAGISFTRHYVPQGQTVALCGAINLKLPSSDLMGTPIHDCPTCGDHARHRTPPSTPAAPALPEVPEGYIAVYSIYNQHLVKRGHQTTLCLKRLSSRGLDATWDERKGECVPCPDCAVKAARAAAPKAGRKKAGKAPKPAIYSSSPLFDAIALFSFKAADKADVNAVAGRVAKIRVALADYVVEKLGHEPTPEETEKVVNRVKELPDWYARTCKKCDRPQSPDTFMTWYVRFVQSTNGTAQGEGDGVWFDNGYWKRENGVLYKQNERNSEQWEAVK